MMTSVSDRFFRPYRKKKNVEGVVFDFWIGDADGQLWYDLLCTDPEWLEMRFVRDHLIKQGDVVLECGGHHGCTAVLLSNWVGCGGRVTTFEPSPANCMIIENNIRENGLSNVYLERKAVGARRGRINISDASNCFVNEAGEGLEVELTCLDEYSHLRPTFLKIDVEGFEMQVLEGARKILSTHPKMAIELHADYLSLYGRRVEDLFRLIDVENYEVWIQWEAGLQPEKYNMGTRIKKRVHLFFDPL